MARSHSTAGLLARAFDAAMRAGSAARVRFAGPGDPFAGERGGRRVQPAYHAAGNGPSIPQVTDLGPFDGVRFMRPCQRLVRHAYRNDNWIRSLVDKSGELFIPGMPVPVSRFPELDDLFCLASRRFDARGVSDLGTWLRDDVHRDFTIDGEACVRRRGRDVRRGRDGSLIPERGLFVPMQWQSLPSAYLPISDGTTETAEVARGNRVISGIEFDVIESRVAYHPYRRHPLDRTQPGTPLTQTRVAADEFHHLFIPAQTGAPRPEVPLAAAILMALKNAQFLDNNAQQMNLSACFSVMIEEDRLDGDDSPEDEEVREALQTLVLGGGNFARLPPGFKARSLQAAANPNFAVTVRTNAFYVCTGQGVPYFEMTGDYESTPERAMRHIGLSTRRRGDVIHARYEHQLLNPMADAFVDGCLAMGLWRPPPGRPIWEAYERDWQWPITEITQMSQELAALLKGVDSQVIDPDTVTRSVFGVKPEVKDRLAARAAARSEALGLAVGKARWDSSGEIPQRILAQVTEEERRERDVVEESAREDGAIDPERT